MLMVFFSSGKYKLHRGLSRGRAFRSPVFKFKRHQEVARVRVWGDTRRGPEHAGPVRNPAGWDLSLRRVLHNQIARNPLLVCRGALLAWSRGHLVAPETTRPAAAASVRFARAQISR